MKRIFHILAMLATLHVFGCFCVNEVKAAECWNPDGTHSDNYEFEEVSREEALCEKEGFIVLRCVGCREYTKKQIIPMKGHDFSVLVLKVEPTLHKEGFSQYKCSRCEETIIKDTKYPSHILRTKIDPEPTCTEKGRYLIYCLNCDYIEAYPRDELGHDWKLAYLPKANCGRSVYKRFECTRCNATYQEEILPTGEHILQEHTVTYPTCNQEGEKSITCQNCGYEKREPIPKSDEHLWQGSWSSFVGNCKEIPVEFECSVCHKTKIEIIPPEGTHDFKEKSRKDATCSADGAIIYYCWKCGDEYTEAIPAYDHNYVLKEDATPNCGADVFKILECTLCHKKIEEIIPASGLHNLSETITKKAICGVDGEKRIFCENCDYSITETIPPLSAVHTWEVVFSKPALCMEDGVLLERCSICGEENRVKYPAIGHKWDEGVRENDGNVLYTCENDATHILRKEGERPSEFESDNASEKEPDELDGQTEKELPEEFLLIEAVNGGEKALDGAAYEDISHGNLATDTVIEEADKDSKDFQTAPIVIIFTIIPLAGIGVIAIKMGWLKKIL